MTGRRTEIVEEVETITLRGDPGAVRAAIESGALNAIPAEPQISLPDGFFFAYYVAGEAWYADRIGVERDEIMVVAAAHGGGCAWEFGVRVHDLGQHDTAIRVEVFGDAFGAFTQARPFFDALDAEKPTALDGVRAILDRLGARDGTERVRPGESEPPAEVPDFRLRCPFCGGELSISLDWRGSGWLSEQVPDAIQCGDCFAEWERNGDLRLAPEAASLAEALRHRR